MAIRARKIAREGLDAGRRHIPPGSPEAGAMPSMHDLCKSARKEGNPASLPQHGARRNKGIGQHVRIGGAGGHGAEYRFP